MKKSLFIIIAFLTFSKAIAFGSFDEAVENSRDKESENDSQKAEKTDPSTSSSASSDFCGSLCEAGCEICSDIGLEFWAENLKFTYGSYPYSDDASRDRKQRFSVSSSFLWLKDLGIGNISSFNCMLVPFAGLFAENLFLYDNINKEGSMGNVTAGLQIPLVQFSSTDLFIRAGCTKWYNEAHSLLKKVSFLGGLELRIFPVEPLAFRTRLEWQFFKDNVYIFDCEMEAGFLINRAELFAGWKHLSIGNSSSNSSTDNWNGISSGLRIHF